MESVPMLEEPTLEEVKGQMDDLTLTFKDKGCCRSGLVGGKGAQHGLLTSIQLKVRHVVSYLWAMKLINSMKK
jgi:hypothetical protein